MLEQKYLSNLWPDNITKRRRKTAKCLFLKWSDIWYCSEMGFGHEMSVEQLTKYLAEEIAYLEDNSRWYLNYNANTNKNTNTNMSTNKFINTITMINTNVKVKVELQYKLMDKYIDISKYD